MVNPARAAKNVPPPRWDGLQSELDDLSARRALVGVLAA
jgi:hypothetical protein